MLPTVTNSPVAIFSRSESDDATISRNMYKKARTIISDSPHSRVHALAQRSHVNGRLSEDDEPIFSIPKRVKPVDVDLSAPV